MDALSKQSCGASALGYAMQCCQESTPADLTSDDVYVPDPVHDFGATDASFGEFRQIREAAMKAHAEVPMWNPDCCEGW